MRKAALNAEDDMGRRRYYIWRRSEDTLSSVNCCFKTAPILQREIKLRKALFTALLLINAHLHVTKFLLDRGAHVCAENSEKAQAIHIACQQVSPDVIKLLLDYGASISTEGECCRQPLHYAAQSSQLSACKLLLEIGSNIEAEDEDKERPLHLAAANGHDSVCLALLDHGSDVNSLDEFGRSALHYAADDGIARVSEKFC